MDARWGDTGVRIFDRIASGESVIPWDANGPRTGADIAWRKAANTNVRVIADEAYDYQAAHGLPKEISMSDIGQMTPPFSDMWIEWKTDSGSNALVLHSRRDSDGDFVWRGVMAYSARPGTEIHMLPMTFVMVSAVDDDGRVVAVHSVLLDGESADHFSPHFYTPMLAIAWMNCKNLMLVEHKQPRRVMRKRLRNGMFPGLSYSSIEVVPSHRKSWEKSAGGTSASCWHTVKGNLATYTDERPLFGIPGRTGRYWRPAHARGNPSKGSIHHEYHVTAEAAQ